MKINYWELRKIVKNIIPRMSSFEPVETKKEGLIREKGRKANYHQFNLETGVFEKNERLLNLEEMNSFLEVSLRSQACPMSLNMDVWDGLYCPHACKYCYADAFRASLYTSFFDNSKSMGLRFCNPDYYKTELDKIFKFRGSRAGNLNDIQKAVSLEMPIRFGIRFEDFLAVEGEKKIALEMLKFLRLHGYPVMINTKGDLIGREDYVKELAENKGKAAVHITMISSDEELLKKIEPGAPPFSRRLQAAIALTSSGVKVVARIEPFMVFINDSKDYVDDYLSRIKAAGITSITFDTYSYSAYNPGIRANFQRLGYDFDRMFMVMSDAQWLGSILLGKFMEYCRTFGFTCSTFDLGNVPSNDDDICCEVGSYFGKGFCLGNVMSAIRFVAKYSQGNPLGWADFEQHVTDHGGFLSETLKDEVKHLWNLQGNNSYSMDWGAGLEPMGVDREGLRWIFDPSKDFRQEMLEAIL